jgi:hypothetical protein
MSRCAACQYEPAQGARFCPLCGQALPTQVPVPDWQQARGRVNVTTVTVSVACQYCATPVPVNGPTCSVHCGHCRSQTRIHGLGAALGRANAGGHAVGSCTIVTHPEQSGPSCPGCALEVPLGDAVHYFGVVTSFPCPRCGTAVSSFPAPPWLKTELPNVLQVFGADAEIAARETGHALGLARHAIQPSRMTCPACGSWSIVTAISGRQISCAHCHAVVPVPHDLWQQLHPVATMRRWTLTHLATAPDVQAVPWTDADSPSELLFRVVHGGVVVAETVVCGTTDVKIGRVSSCQIRFDDDALGRIHAIVEVACNGDLSIVDLGSRTGTRLNGELVTSSTPLRIGDRIEIGETTIEVAHPT